MKIYFCGSISGGRRDADIYADHIQKLKNYGEVLTEYVGDKRMSEALCAASDHRHIHDRDVERLHECDVLIAEVTQPSLGVGYEIGRAVALKKPILCLFRPHAAEKLLSCMLRGMGKEVATVVDYKVEDVDQIFKDFFAGIDSSTNK